MLTFLFAAAVASSSQATEVRPEYPAPSVSAQRVQDASTEIENRIVDVDGSTMSLHLSGSGPVAIVLEAGSASDHRNWSEVQPALSALGRVVSYDRAGYGGSGRSARPPTASVVAEQLRQALDRSGIQPPFLLVGHSYGGALVRVFAGRYPQDVLGIVLVDPVQETFYPRASAEASEAYLAQGEEDLAWADGRGSEAIRREFLAYENSMVQTRLAAPPPGDRIVLLSAAQMELAEPLRRIWLDEQAAWARRVGAKHIVVDSGHNIPRQRPTAVIEAVRLLLTNIASRPTN